MIRVFRVFVDERSMKRYIDGKSFNCITKRKLFDRSFGAELQLDKSRYHVRYHSDIYMLECIPKEETDYTMEQFEPQKK